MSLNRKMSDAHELDLVQWLGGRRTPGSGNGFANPLDGRHSRYERSLAWAWDGKPLDPSSRIRMADGTARTLSDVKVGEKVVTHTGAFASVIANVNAGIQQRILVTTKRGRKIIAGVDHHFLTTRGWLPAEKIEPIVDALAVRPGSLWDNDCISLDESRMMGYLIGDGSIGQYGSSDIVLGSNPMPGTCACGCGMNVNKGKQWIFGHHARLQSARGMGSLSSQFTNVDQEVIEDFKRCCHILGWNVKPYSSTSYGISGGVRDWLRNHGMAGQTSHTKKVPDAVMKSSTSVVAAFLSGYLDTDGTVTGTVATKTGQRVGSCVSFNTVSRILAEDVQHLLARLNVKSTISVKQTRVGKDGPVKFSWLVTVRHHFDVDLLWRSLTPVHKEKSERLSRWALMAPGRFGTSELWDDRVVSLKWLESGPVMCLMVGHEDHSYFANDVVVHNSTLGKSVGVSREMWNKLVEQAHGERPLLPLRFYNTERLEIGLDLVTMSMTDFLELNERAYD